MESIKLSTIGIVMDLKKIIKAWKMFVIVLWYNDGLQIRHDGVCLDGLFINTNRIVESSLQYNNSSSVNILLFLYFN